MSEAQAPEAAPPPVPAVTAGALLRAAREQAGLPLDEFAALLKVTARRVELIEADQLEQLPDPVFVRALAQTMCRTLKIDPAPVLALLPRTPTQRLDRIHVGLNTPYREGPTQLLPDDWWGKLLPFLGGAALLIAGALLFYFLPSSNWQAPAKVSPRAATAAAESPAVAPQMVSTVVTAPPGSESAAPPSAPATPALERSVVAPVDVARAAPVPAPAAEATPAPARPAPQVMAAVPAPATPVAAAAPPAAAPVTAVARLPAAAPAGLLQLRTSEAVWVQVHDAQGLLLLSRELRAGEAVGLNGATPLKVTVGNVRATQIAFRGKAMDLRSFTRDNVARIELQ
ncbi:MAG: helix-turn-helix domain-containing protein [Burkholderiaceae bacterium]